MGSSSLSSSGSSSSTTSDPFVNYRYRIEIDGLETMGFSKISELSNETETMPYSEGGLNNRIHKLPMTTSYGNITLEHGLSLDDTLYDWRQEVLDGKMVDALRSGSIKVYAQNNLTSIWHFYGAWPSKLVVSGLDASARNGEVIVESVELVVERFERVVSTED